MNSISAEHTLAKSMILVMLVTPVKVEPIWQIFLQT